MIRNIAEKYDLTEQVEDLILNQKTTMKNGNLKRFAISSYVTFISVFAVTFCAAVAEPNFVFSKASFVSLIASGLIVAVRAVTKVVMEFALGFVPKE